MAVRIADDLQWPSRSFTCCKSCRVEFSYTVVMLNLCNIWQDFDRVHHSVLAECLVCFRVNSVHDSSFCCITVLLLSLFRPYRQPNINTPLQRSKTTQNDLFLSQLFSSLSYLIRISESYAVGIIMLMFNFQMCLKSAQACLGKCHNWQYYFCSSFYFFIVTQW